MRYLQLLFYYFRLTFMMLKLTNVLSFLLLFWMQSSLAQLTIFINNTPQSDVYTSQYNGKTTLLLNGNWDIQQVVSASSALKYETFASYAAHQPMTTILLEDSIIAGTIHISGSIKNMSFKRNSVTTTNSLLSSGDWYKLSITESGVYAIDQSVIEAMGLNPTSVNPDRVRVFGHYGGSLPLLAGDTPIDDLQEIPVLVNASGSEFGDGDNILFYVEGITTWDYDEFEEIFLHQKHLYSDNKYIFVQINSSVPSMKVPNGNTDMGTPTSTANTYIDRAYIENDLQNLLKSGAEKMGEEFVSSEGISYNFTFSNIDNSPAKILIAAAARSTYSSSNFQVNANNFTLGNFSILRVGSSQEDIYANYDTKQFAWNNPASGINVNIQYQRPDFDARAWIDYVVVQVKRILKYEGIPLYFRSLPTTGSLTSFTISNANSGLVLLDITDAMRPKRLAFNGANFIDSTTRHKEYVLFSNTSNKPSFVSKVNNQNLHGLAQVPYIIIAPSVLMGAAKSLADFHLAEDNMPSQVVDIEQIYNEFSAGCKDVCAIRNFAKMFYDRAQIDPQNSLKYLLLFGDGSYDIRNNNPYYLPIYESMESLDPIKSYPTDDFFACLDDIEGADINNTFINKPDIAIGRIPADNIQKAEIIIQKIKDYYASFAYGDWRNQVSFLADDGDGVTHIDDADRVARIVEDNYKNFNVDKIYCDAFAQQSNAGGARYPDVNSALSKKIYSGTFFLNYAGHGGGRGLADEQILTYSDINNWQNTYKYPIFITATCEFTRYDGDDYVAGERILFKESGGAIGLVSTSRLVYANENYETNRNLVQQLMTASQGSRVSLGEVVRLAKTLTNTREGNRKFGLFGDPALQLAFPKYNIVTTSINSVALPSNLDTLKALEKVTITAEVRDGMNSLMQNFVGTAYTTVYDKSRRINTLQNDPDSSPYTFSLRKNILFRGKATVVDGKFSVSFIVPRDIDYTIGLGKISHYAYSDTADAVGYNYDVYVGGVADSIAQDNTPPKISLFLDDKSYAFGSITDNEPLLLAEFFDENGINISGSGIGHDITAIIDENTQNAIVLNNFYASKDNSYQEGLLNYPLSKLENGRHSLRVRAFDNYNNSGEAYTEFIVEENGVLALHHVLNYPNPFTTKTEFIFEQNKIGSNLNVKIDIYTVTGRLVKSIQQEINSADRQIRNIFWDGKDDFGDDLAKGIYIYKVSVKDNGGQSAQEIQKLVLLRH